MKHLTCRDHWYVADSCLDRFETLSSALTRVSLGNVLHPKVSPPISMHPPPMLLPIACLQRCKAKGVANNNRITVVFLFSHCCQFVKLRTGLLRFVGFFCTTPFLSGSVILFFHCLHEETNMLRLCRGLRQFETCLLKG